MPDLAPFALASNAPESDGTPHITEPPPVVDVPEVAPDTSVPGVYIGGVLVAAPDENGVMVQVPEVTQ